MKNIKERGMSIKIKFASNWDNSTSLAQRVERNWGEAPDGFEVVTEGDFDYLEGKEYRFHNGAKLERRNQRRGDCP